MTTEMHVSDPLVLVYPEVEGVGGGGAGWGSDHMEGLLHERYFVPGDNKLSKKGH